MPVWIGFLYQVHLPGTFPTFDLLFTRNSIDHIVMRFIINKHVC